ncbi:MAG: ABC transporter permease, partial [Desulfobacula sp.]|nr:ABC transporter permease [Desulfobacula sp.]
MLFRRIYQFLLVYIITIVFLFMIKILLSLSDYVIPGVPLMIETTGQVFKEYFFDVMNTMSITILGQCLSIIMAFTVGIAGRKSSWIGSFIKVTAYNIQAYPIVALAPIIFILLGDGFI